MFTISQPKSQQEFAAYYDLRWRVLREPWNQPRGSERDELDVTAQHVMALDENDRLVGVGCLHFTSQDDGQIRYMAIEQDVRGVGIGRAILERLEVIANKQGLRRITLYARDNVVGFYQRLGYQVTGEGHTLFDVIKHAKMGKDL